MTRTPPLLPRRHFLARVLAGLAAGTWLGRAGGSDRAEAATQAETPFIGEIRMFAGSFAPAGWAFCEGQLLAVAQNEPLFFLIGTMYGGDGVTTFALPDLRGRAPVHMGTGPGGFTYQQGEQAGTEQTTLTVQQIPIHSHASGASSAGGTSDDPAGRVLARNAAGVPQYAAVFSSALASGAVLPVGGSSPHNNMQPYLCIHHIISLTGLFPSQS